MTKTSICLQHHNILWTGGWDSTFSLLTLLLEKRLQVTPIYLLDSSRRSMPLEVEAMSKIRRSLKKLDPDGYKRLSPTVYYAVDDIPPDAEIQKAYNAIKQHHHLGTQYEWLARFCKNYNIDKIHLSVEVGGALERLIRNIIEPGDQENPFPRINTENTKDPFCTIFKYFYFPVINMTKDDMKRISWSNNWQSIMEMTWFCFYPSKNKKPCGVCNPCRIAVKEGFGWRIPATNRVYGAIYRRTIDPLRARTKKLLKAMRGDPPPPES